MLSLMSHGRYRDTSGCHAAGERASLTKTISRKKKPMKTNNVKTSMRESNLPESDRRANTAQPSGTDPKPEQFTRIDHAKREANRQLSTRELLAVLRDSAPEFYQLAEVVGRWVWIHFEQRQPRTVTAQLAELGFHWNNTRQTWQHPCGAVTQGTTSNPREKYGSHFAVDHQPF